MAKAKQVEEQQAERITRSAAANQVVAECNGKTTLSALAQQADELFVEGGGESKIRAATHTVKRSLEALEAVGVVRLVRPSDIQVERVKGK